MFSHITSSAFLSLLSVRIENAMRTCLSLSGNQSAQLLRFLFLSLAHTVVGLVLELICLDGRLFLLVHCLCFHDHVLALDDVR